MFAALLVFGAPGHENKSRKRLSAVRRVVVVTLAASRSRDVCMLSLFKLDEYFLCFQILENGVIVPLKGTKMFYLFMKYCLF